ncbi:MAG: LCP family protein [Lachnospiraceae bacterium]|nr:LCP family protein [Lachnospiraceae bacterium]
MSEQNKSRRKHIPKQVADIVVENEDGFDIDWDSIENNVEHANRVRRSKHRHRMSSSLQSDSIGYPTTGSNGDDKDNSSKSGTVLNHSVKIDNDKKSKKKSKGITAKKVLLIILAVILSIIIGLIIAFSILRKTGMKKLFDYNNLNIQTIDDATTDNRGKTIVYNGKTYDFNPYVTSILFIGVDKETLDLVDNTVGTGGQADALYLLAYNATSGNVKVVSISRDTLIDVNTYTVSGDYAGVMNTQLCLSYAYGDGKDLSAKNVLTSVRRMMFNIPINTYLAMDLKAISKMNDSIGGVRLNSMITVDDIFTEGEDVLIKGDMAEKYVRYRDTSVLDSNNNRMQRQQQYLNAFSAKLVEATKNDVTTPLKILNDSSDYLITNFDTSRVTYLASSIIQDYSGLNIINIPGDVVEKEGKAVFIPDETSLFETLLDIYYICRD